MATPQPAEAGPKHAEGDRVLYWSTTHKVWIRSIVVGISRYPDGTVLAYDLDCKAGAEPACVRKVENISADERLREAASTNKVVTSPQGPQNSPVEPESLSIGDRVEYCSLSSGKWLRSRVLKIYRKSGYCDLDIKRGAPLDRLRKVETASTGLSTGALVPDANKIAAEKAARELAAFRVARLAAAKISVAGDSGAPLFNQFVAHTSSKAKPPSPPPRRSAPPPHECDMLSDSSDSSFGGFDLTEIQEWERWKARQERGRRNWAALGGHLRTTNGTLQQPSPKVGIDQKAKPESPDGVSTKVAALLAPPQARSGGTGRRCRRETQGRAPSQKGVGDSAGDGGSQKRGKEKHRNLRQPDASHGEPQRPLLRRNSPTLSPVRSLSSSPAILRRPRLAEFLKSPTPPRRLAGLNRARTLSPPRGIRRRHKDMSEAVLDRRSPASVLAKRPPCRRRSPSSEPPARQWRQASRYSDGSSGSPLPRRPRWSLSSSSPRIMVKRDVGRRKSSPRRPVVAHTSQRSRSRSIRFASRQERLSSPPGPARPWRRGRSPR